MSVKIQLNTKGYLEVGDDVSIPINFGISPIQNISEHKGGYSLTVLLPNSPENDIILGDAYDANLDYLTFNPNKKERFIMTRRGVIVFQGVMQLTNIIKISPSLENPDQFVNYELLLTDDTSNFYSDMGDKLLTDLGYDSFNKIYTGWTQYDHIFNEENVIGDGPTGGSRPWYEVYTYGMTQKSAPGLAGPLLTTEFNNYNLAYYLTDFSPAIYARVYLDKITSELGYSYEWRTNLNNPQPANRSSLDIFNHLVIPFNGKSVEAPKEYYKFFAGYSQGGQQVFPNVTNGNSYYLVYDIDYTYAGDERYYDYGNNYNNTNGGWTSQFNGNVTFQVYYHIKLELFSTTFKSFQKSNAGADSSIDYIITHHTVGSMGGGPPYVNYNVPGANLTYNISTNLGLIVPAFTNVEIREFDMALNVNGNVNIGQTIDNYITGQVNINNGFWVDSNGAFTTPPDFKVTISNTDAFGSPLPLNNHFTINDSPLQENMPVFLEKFVPQKVKQREFIDLLVKTFNLYISNDPDRDKHLIIESRDDFYANGGQKDWTDLFDIEAPSELKPLPDLQNRKIKLTYKQDSDETNKDYEDSTKEVYGQVEYEFVNNEFVQETKIIENIASPTPLVKNINTTLIVPAINSVQPKNNIRLLYKPDRWIIANGGLWVFRSGVYDTSTRDVLLDYPYMGHFDDPYFSTIDINYGICDEYYYIFNELTDNQLYNNFYKRFFSQIENGKLFTAQIKLSEFEIMNLNLRDKIFIHDSYWIINSINSYNANGNGLTQVEFLSLEPGFDFIPTRLNNYPAPPLPPNPGGGGGNPTPNPPPLGGGGGVMNASSLLNQSNSNNFAQSATFNVTLGSNNILQENASKNQIIGNNNNNAGQNNFILGDGVTVNGSNIMALGLSNVNLDRSNTINVGAPILPYIHIVTAGRNVVLSPFNSIKTINIIKAGRNEVLAIGSNSIETLVSAGRVIIPGR